MNKYLIMMLPTIQGSLLQSDYLIYTSCDTQYFAEFGTALIQSIKTNTGLGIHVHLFNPTLLQIDYCKNHNVSVTYEFVSLKEFQPAAAKWQSTKLSDLEKTQLDRTTNAMTKGRDQTLLERMQKTYYACARFIRLAELFDGQSTVLSIDVDAVVRSTPNLLNSAKDFYVHQITGKKARILAGGIYLGPTPGSQQFLNEYADQLCQYLNNDYIYWGLDQDLLDIVVPKYNHGHLPIQYIDWNMNPSSFIWTAKGTRKESPVFVNEKQKYML
jgi:hypothetical protein